MNKHSLRIAVFFSTFFSPHLFSANLLVYDDDQKEGSYSTQSNNQVQQPKQIYDYTILNNKNINHTLDDIEEVEDDLRDNVLGVDQKLVTTNNQFPPLLLGAVLQHKETNEHHQYLITSTGLLSETTQPNAVKRAHKKGFHLIKATRGHVTLQLLEWLQISKHYIVITLHTNRPVCRNCDLIVHNLWKKKLSTSEKGCVGVIFPLLDKMPNLAQQYINTHLNLSIVQKLVVPMMGYVSKEAVQKVIQQKNNTISMLSNIINANQQQLAGLQSIMSTEAVDENKMTPFLHAVQKRQFQIAQLLKGWGANIHAKNKWQNNALHFACLFSNNVAMVTWLLDECNISIETKGYGGKTPFLCAAEKGNLAVAKLLRQRGANIHTKNTWGDNALHWACLFSGSEAMVRWLLDVCKISIEARGENQKTPFLCTAQKGQLAIAKLLKKRGASTYAQDWNRNNALHYACWDSGSEAMVTWLLDKCNIGLESKGYREKTPFICAVSKGQFAIGNILIKRGANIYAKNAFGNNALHLVCLFSGKLEIVEWLLDVCKIGIEAKGHYQRTPFLCAARQGHLSIAKLLRQHGADIHATDKWGNNALDAACWDSGSEAMVTWLLDKCKIVLNAKGYKEKTPFLCAVQKGHLAIAKLLRQRGANIYAKNAFGNNALHLACLYSGSVAMVTWLLDMCKIDIESKGQYGKTPFLCAQERGQLVIVNLLKGRGANIYATDSRRNNAFH